MENPVQHMLELKGLEIGFGQKGKKRHAVSGPLNCALPAGELIALMGINGSGKSTLLRTLAGLQKPLDGTVHLLDRELRQYPGKALARILGYVSTEVVRVQGMQVKQLVSMGRYPYTNWLGSFSKDDHETVEKALELTSLQAFGERDLDELSDGERQRAMIARTLAQDTSILLLDEPTAFLDLTHKYEVIHLLKTLSHEHQKTILFSTHDLQIALREADKLWLMNRHDITEGAPEDLALSGELSDALLEETPAIEVSLDLQSGDFRLHREYRSSVSVSAGKEALKQWTIRSVERMGYRYESNKIGDINVIVEEKGDQHVWIVEKNGQRVELTSIYDLSLYLQTIV